MPIIEVQGLARDFGSVRALAGVSYTVDEGQVFGLLGPNGSGKTTSVRLLNGVLAPTAGTARVLGLDPVADGPAVRRQTGVLTENPSLYERLTARENLMIFGALYGIPETRLRAQVEEMLDLLQLSARADDKAGGFSKGMKQRLALARALLHAPPLLFLDEPTSGLDPEASHQVVQLIEKLCHEKGRTILLCTHNLDEAQRLCDRVAVMSQGSILALGTIAELSHRLWQGTWVDVELLRPAPRENLPAIRERSGALQLQSAGNCLSFELQGEDLVPELVAALAGQGLPIVRVNPRRYSLEEIYFRLQGQQKEGRP